MLKYKRMFISLGIVLFFAVIIQFLRMNTLIEWSKASNTFFSVDHVKAVNIEIPSTKEKVEPYLIYYDNSDLISKEIFNHIVKFFNSTKKEYTAMDAIRKEDLSTDKTIIVAARKLDALGDITLFVDFLESGGRVVFAGSLEKDSNFNYIQQKIGIYEVGYLYHSKGAHFVPGVLPGGALEVEGDGLQSISLSVRLNEDCEVFAKADDGNPLFWEVDVGKGKAVVFNNTFLTEKSGMGVFTAALTKAEEVFLYPIINSRAMLLNYFPVVLVGNEAYMKQNYGRNTEGFIRDIWWPHMAKTASQYDFKYTSFFLISLDRDTDKSFVENIAGTTNLSFIGREILRYGGELAISGYNDIPLVFNQNGHGNRYWKDIKKAEEALSLVNQTFKRRFQNYALRSYSPPYGILSQEGYGLVERAMGDLAVINGVYEGDSNTQTLQDFDTNQRGIINFPTVSKGFNLTEREYWNLANAATAFGVISHSLDLREVMMVDNETMDWNNLGEDFSHLAENIYDDFGWISSRTVSQAAEEIKKYKGIKPYILKDQNQIEVYNDNFIGPMGFIVRYEKGVKALKGCTITKLEDGFYYIEATEPIFAIELGGRI